MIFTLFIEIIDNFVIYPSTFDRPAPQYRPGRGGPEVIDEAEGGCFWLLPWSIWQPWAREGLGSAEKRMALK
jgi:hypothetical protein